MDVAQLLRLAIADPSALGQEALEDLRTSPEGRGPFHQQAVPLQGLA